MKKVLKGVTYTLLVIVVFLNIISAFHAYKFTHFYDKGDVGVKKPELMTGWEKTKAILFGVNYPKRPPADAPTFPYNTFTITTSDNLVLEGWYAGQQNSKGTVILFHGHAGNKAGVNTEAEAFYKFGYNTCQVDFRAHGNSKGNICTIGYDESKDVKAAYDFVAEKGERNIILWGISLGAATITKAVKDYPEMKPSKLILEMPFASLSDAVEGRLRTMGLPEQPLSTLLTFWGGVEQGFWTFGHSPANYAKSIHTPTLLQWGEHDGRVTEAETKEIYSNISVKKKAMIVYSQSGHQSLLKNEPEKWLQTVDSFLRQ